MVERVISIVGVVCTAALMAVGIIGICVAIKTLKTLGKQAVIMRRQTRHIARQALSMRRQTTILRASAEAAKDSADAAKASADIAEKSLILLNRSYLAVTDWSIPAPIHGQNETLEIRFSVFNPSSTAARIEAIEISKPRESTLPVGYMLTPGEKKPFAHVVENVKSEEKVLLAGRIIYTDIFHKLRHRKFAQLCWCRPGYPVFAAPDIAGLNDEEEWDKNDS